MTSRRLSSRIRFNRALFAAPADRPMDELLEALRIEDITLVIDARPDAPDTAELTRACAEAETYFVRRPELAPLAARPAAEPDRAHAWAAHMALRHRTCVLGRRGVAQAVAGLVGLEVIELGHVTSRRDRETP